MPYNSNRTLLVSEFRGKSESDILWTDLRTMQSWNSFRYLYGKPISVGFAFRRPWEGGHSNLSQHYAGLAFDVGNISESFGDTPSGKWLSENAHLYGFIIRYPKGKQSITGYIYEPWHIRYLGTEVATEVKTSGLTLEEYLGI